MNPIPVVNVWQVMTQVFGWLASSFAVGFVLGALSGGWYMARQWDKSMKAKP